MRSSGMIIGTLVLSLLATGCATKKYVAKTIAPVEQRVTGTESKNTEQDQQIAGQGNEIRELDRGLSQTKEKLTDTDAKAAQAAEAARVADQKAGGAQQSADGAKQAADGARQAADGAKTFAEQVGRNAEAMNKFHVAKSETILFRFNSDVLTPETKQQLDDLAKQAAGMDRYEIEVQGFTDKSGDPTYNETLSERRAHAVARYLANQYKLPVRNIALLGSGYAQPVADDKTREGRKMNRRVEVKLWVPEATSATVATGGGGD